MTLRQQLMLKRALRQLRTWAPPISIGIIVGAGAFLIVERGEPQSEPQPAAATAFAQPVSTRAFANCDEARDANAAPVYRGQPGYGSHLDADNDGVGCEPYFR
jgi:hypothetical protein